MQTVTGYKILSHDWRPPVQLTVGIREAYHYGLGVALPTGPKELGYAMVER